MSLSIPRIEFAAAVDRSRTAASASRAVACVAALVATVFAPLFAQESEVVEKLRSDVVVAEDAPAIEEVRPEIYYLKDEAGGLLPVPGFRYRDFVEMLRLKNGLPRGPQPPPAAITSVVLEGRIGEDECRGTVEVKVVQTEAGWVSVPLALDGMRFTDPPAHVGAGRFVVDADRGVDTGGYRAWFEGAAGDGHSLLLHGVLAVERSAAQEAVVVELPRATASSVRLTTRLVDPVVVIDPQRIPAEVSPNGDDESMVSITGLAGRARIRLREKAAMTPESIAAPQSVGEILVRIDGRRAMSDVTLRLAGLSAETRTVAVRLPPNGTVASVRPPSSLVAARGEAGRPEAVFAIERSPAGEATLRFECETPVDLGEGKVLEPLAYAVEGIPNWRQWGRVSLLVNGDWQVSWGPVPANRRVDPPPTVDRQTCVGAFAYDSQPAKLPLQVKPLGSRVVVEPEYGYTVGSSRIELEVRLRISVRGAPIGSIELGLDGWGIDSVGPSGLVDGSSLSGAAGRLVIPFVKPLSGNGTVELRATRLISRTDESVSWTLPVPKANLVGPASVTIVSDSDIELVPDAKKIRGLVRQVAPASAGKGAEASTLAYRLEGSSGDFAATRRFLPRRVDASVAARATVDRSDMVVDENLRFDVAYVPLESVSLAVPRRILESGSLEVRHNDQLLNVREEPSSSAASDVQDAKPAQSRASTDVVVVRTELPAPRLGAVDLRIRYAVKTPDVPVETTVPEELPLVMPIEGRVSRQSFTVDSQAGLTVDVRGEQWKRDAPVAPTAGMRSWTASKPQDTVPIALSAERQTASAVTTVEAAWLVTRLLPDRREDSFRYRISTAAPSLLVTLPASSLPAGIPEGSIEVRLDGRSITSDIQPGGRMLVDLSTSGGVGGYLLEIEQVQPRPSLLRPLALEAPAFGQGTVLRRFYWELRLQPDEHVVRQPSTWTSQQAWRWTGTGLRRMPLVSIESLEAWLSAKEAPGDVPPRPLPPMAEARSVYAGIGWPGRESAWVAPSWLCVLAISGPLLLLGLAVVYRPRIRGASILLSLATAAVAIACAAPDQMPMVVQAALPGCALTVIAAALRWVVGPRRERDDAHAESSVVISGSSTRAAATPSLVIGSTARAEIDGAGLAMLIAVSLLAGGAARADEPPAAAPIRFMRVHVPTERISPDLLGAERYVPMPLAEFDAALGRSAAGLPSGGAAIRGVTAATYRLAWSGSSGLAGQLEFTVEESLGRFPFVVPVPGFRPTDATVESREGTGVASVIGRDDGLLAIVVRAAGRYRCTLRAAGVPPADPVRGADGSGRESTPPRTTLSIPLVPALTSTIDLTVPPEVVPIAEAAVVRPVVEGARQGIRGGRTFRIESGPVAAIRIWLEPSMPIVPLAATNVVVIERKEFRVSASLAPARPWNRDEVFVVLDPGLVVTGARVEGAHAVATPLFREMTGDGGRMRLAVPPTALGRRFAITIDAVAPFDLREATPVPLVRPMPDEWASGTVQLSLDAATTFTSLDVDGATIIDTPERGSAGSGAVPTAAIEQQSASGSVRVSVAARPPEIDTARVTTIDITEGTVTGRTAANVAVRGGIAFELKGLVGPEWLIDAVEIPGEPIEFDWSVDASAPSRMLRIGLVRGIVPGRGLVVRVVGHRPPLPRNEPVASSRLDMIRFEGENEGQPLLDLRTNAETTILVGGIAAFPQPMEDLSPRLRPLTEAAAPRARLLAGELAESREVTVLRRRPPVDVHTQIRVTARDDRLSESFTFECAARDSEIDSVVVRFSETDDAPLEWTILAPAAAKATARRDETTGRAAGDAGGWLVEIAPPVRGSATLRATRSVPFRSPRPIPLAWVEGAATATGEIFIRDAGRERATVVSSRLPEMPGSTGAGTSATPLAAFTFDVRRDLNTERSPVVELAPGVADTASARAWAWSESTTTRCHESGLFEYETSYVVENRGRAGVMLQIPPDRRLEEISVDGVRLTGIVGEGGGSEVPVELPPGRRLVRLHVRMLAQQRPFLGTWSVDARAAQIDVPILERSWQLLLPPGIEIAVRPLRHLDADALRPSLMERLTGLGGRADAEAFASHRFVPATGPADAGAATLIRTSMLLRIMILFAAGGFAVACGFVRRRPAVVILAALVAGLATLWAPAPWFSVARCGLHGLAVGAVVSLASRFRVGRIIGSSRRAIGAAAAIALSAVTAGDRLEAADAMAPHRVFVTPGGVALVPEPLFRGIASGSPGPGRMSPGAVRSRLVVGADADAGGRAWRLEVDFEGEAGDRFSLGQSPDEARFVAGSAVLDGVAVPEAVTADGRSVSVTVGGFGRHSLRVDVEPTFVEHGGVEETVVGIPVAASSIVALPLGWLPDGDAPHVCEWSAVGDAVWRSAERLDDGSSMLGEFDVSAAARVRLTRTRDRAVSLVASPAAVACDNAIEWDVGECRLTVSIEADASGGRRTDRLCRGVSLAVDPRLEPVLTDGGPRAGWSVVEESEGRLRLEWSAPQPGPQSAELSFRMPLANPVGVFEVPVVAPAEAGAGSVDARLRTASSSLRVTAALPDSAVPKPPSGEEVVGRFVGWSARTPMDPVTIGVTRRETAPTGSQQVVVRFGPTGVSLRLEGQLRARGNAMSRVAVAVPRGCVVDAVRLLAVDSSNPSAEQPPLDIRSFRESDERFVAVLQRPRTGRVRIEIDARLPGQPAARGLLPLMRLEPLATETLPVSWTTEGDFELAFGAADDFATAGSLDVAAGQPPPYRMVERRRPADGTVAGAEAAPPATAAEGETRPTAARTGHAERVEVADVRLAIDDRGRAWGVVRFDLVTNAPSIRIRLPRGLRLFEALVDDHPLPTKPLDADVWEARLLDVSRPRSVVAVFAGELGRSVSEGQAIELPAPDVESMPVREVLWTIRGPRDRTIRFLPGPAEATVEMIAAARRAAVERLTPDIVRAFEGRNPDEQARIRSFLDRDEPADESSPEVMWDRSSRGLAREACVRTEGPGPAIRFRIARSIDPTLPLRVAGTLSLVACCAVAWRTAHLRRNGG